MREIEFRGKRTDGEGWVYGNLARFYKDTCITFDNTDDNWSTGRDSEDVIPETVGQYTGLKDKNGVKIFEGDIIRWNDIDAKTKTGHVLYFEKESGYDVCILREPRKSLFWVVGLSCEVISNIHDNPKLLEKENKYGV
jgi:uncharacterized phage protein (TIGR01671 family)